MSLKAVFIKLDHIYISEVIEPPLKLFVQAFPHGDGAISELEGTNILKTKTQWSFCFENPRDVVISFSILAEPSGNLREVGKLVLPLGWFQYNTVVREVFPLVSKVQPQPEIFITLDVHVSMNSAPPFRAPEGKIIVVPCWKKPEQIPEQNDFSPPMPQIIEEKPLPASPPVQQAPIYQSPNPQAPVYQAAPPNYPPPQAPYPMPPYSTAYPYPAPYPPQYAPPPGYPYPPYQYGPPPPQSQVTKNSHQKSHKSSKSQRPVQQYPPQYPVYPQGYPYPPQGYPHPYPPAPPTGYPGHAPPPYPLYSQNPVYPGQAPPAHYTQPSPQQTVVQKPPPPQVQPDKRPTPINQNKDQPLLPNNDQFNPPPSKPVISSNKKSKEQISAPLIEDSYLPEYPDN